MKLVIGFITYRNLTAKYLPYFLSSLSEGSFKNYEIIAFDNSEEENNENQNYIKKNYLNIELLWFGKNFGFARAYNKLIKKAVKRGAEYFLMLNPDMIIEPDTIQLLINKMDDNKNLAAVCPKVLRWNFKDNKKTKIIDTLGIKLNFGLHFFDLGQNQVDKGQFNQVKIIGPSGVAGLYRLSSLEKIKEDNQYFDELMFMYKEDCDLAYRFFLANLKVKLISEAIAYHDRTVSAKGVSTWQILMNRKNKSKQVKRWSFLNQQIIFKKYWCLQKSKDKAIIMWWQFKILVFLLFFEQYLFSEYINYFKIKNRIKKYELRSGGYKTS